MKTHTICNTLKDSHFSRLEFWPLSFMLSSTSSLSLRAHGEREAARGDSGWRFGGTYAALLAPIRKWTGVTNILNVNFSDFIAWWLWRTICLLKLPRLEKKVFVALDWTLDVLFSKDLVHFSTTRFRTVRLVEEALESTPVQISQC